MTDECSYGKRRVSVLIVDEMEDNKVFD